MKLKKCDNCDIIRGISQKLAENLVSISIDNEQLDFAFKINNIKMPKERLLKFYDYHTECKCFK